MFKLTCLSKKIIKIVMGVIVFLCAGLILIGEAYAVEADLIYDSNTYDLTMIYGPGNTGNNIYGAYIQCNEINTKKTKELLFYGTKPTSSEKQLKEYVNTKKSTTINISDWPAGTYECEKMLTLYGHYTSAVGAGCRQGSCWDAVPATYWYEDNSEGIVYFYHKVTKPTITASPCKNIKDHDTCVNSIKNGYQCIWRQNACYAGNLVSNEKIIKISNLNGTTLKGSTWTSDTRTTTGSTIGLPYDTSFKYSNGTDAKGKVIGYATSVANCDSKNYVITMDKVKAGEKVSIGTGTTTFYACWEKTVEPSCYVTFHGEGGKLSGNSLKMFTCTNCDCSNVDFSTVNGFNKTGYKLKGWSESTDCKALVTTDFKKLKATDKRTFYACWESVSATNSFNLTFNGNGGKISSGSNKGKTSVEVVCSGNCKNANFSDAGLFTRTGYQFTGWSENKNCTNLQTSVGRDKTKATTFYACWTPVVSSVPEESFTLTLNQAGGTGFNCPTDYKLNNGLCSKSIIGGKVYTLPNSNSYSTSDNNKFMGWAKNSTTACNSNTMKQPGDKIAIYANTTYYACYKEDINGTMYSMDGASADGQDVTCGAALHITNCVISQDNKQYCYYDKIGSKAVSGKVYRDKLSNSSTIASCDSTQSQEKPEANVTTINGYKYGTISAIRDTAFECGAKLYITTCNDNVCNFTSYVTLDGKTKNVSGTVNKEYLKDSQSAALKDTKNCPKVEENSNNELELKSCANYNSKKLNIKGIMTVNVCYDKELEDQQVKKDIIGNGLISCGYGYEYDKTSTRASGDSLCNDKICVRNYVVSCVKSAMESSVSIITTPAFADANGKGIVKIEAYSSNARIVAYYVSEYLTAPTATSEWISTNSSKFEIESTPGVKYIWVKDSYGAISNVSTLAVIDKNNVNNTLKSLQLSSNGQSLVPNGVSYVTDNNGYAYLSNSVSQKTLIAKGFERFTSEYKIDVDGPTLSVYPTLTSTDSTYVPGYGPRTVNLSYGVNTILIKIQDKEGKIRTYTIIANRIDDRSSDNTLNDINVSVGKIEFNSNVTEYKVEIPKNTTQVTVNSVINSDLASYVEGYEPGVVTITGDTTVKLIKVMSETGSTRTYVISFVKENTDIISKESLQLSGLTIPGVYIPFESNIANYNVSADYTTEVIDIYAALKDNYSVVSISVKKSSETDYKVVSGKGINLDVGDNYVEIKVVDNYGDEAYYRLTIIRKEYGLDISNDTTLKNLSVLGYNINFNSNDKDYTVKIKNEKSLIITAVPNSNRAEVFIRGNNELTGFSTVRIKVVAENGEFETYSVDIKKDAFNKTVEIIALIAGCVIILVSSGIIIKKKKIKNKKDYYRE